MIKHNLPLFEASTADQERNLLPRDGEAFYFGPIFDVRSADQLFTALMTQIEWQQDQAFIYGKHITTRRKYAWYGKAPYRYTYSRVDRVAKTWTDLLTRIQSQIQQRINDNSNACLLNLYHSGEEGMAWHSDDEKELHPGAPVLSLSFGAQRKFSFKHKSTAETVSLELEHGSLLLMSGAIQNHWLHRLPPTKTVTDPRINLTFRTLRDSSIVSS